MNISTPKQEPPLDDRTPNRSMHLWQTVYRGIEKDIRLGKFAPGDQIPTEADLARQYNVHRNTVRRALEVLDELDIIRIEHGVGSFVKERVLIHTMARDKTLPLILRGANRVGREQILAASTQRPKPDVAAALAIARNSYVRVVELLSFVEDKPIMVTSAYFPLPRFHGIDSTIVEAGFVPEALKRMGVNDVLREETRITTTISSRTDAEYLRQPKSQPVLFVRNILVDENGTPVLLSQVRMSPLWIELVIRYGE